jgi:hypothetical protein
MSDRNTEYMKEMWGTNKLATDYNSFNKRKLLREVTDEKFMKEVVETESELFDSWDYGLESFTINK